jgi:hypothetical protein
MRTRARRYEVNNINELYRRGFYAEAQWGRHRVDRNSKKWSSKKQFVDRYLKDAFTGLSADWRFGTKWVQKCG